MGGQSQEFYIYSTYTTEIFRAAEGWGEPGITFTVEEIQGDTSQIIMGKTVREILEKQS